MEITGTANYTIVTDQPLKLDATSVYQYAVNSRVVDNMYTYMNQTGELYKGELANRSNEVLSL